MLILTRRPGERVCIGEEIVITILAVRGRQVRIGITAPRNIAIDREEIFNRKQTERRYGPSSASDSAERALALPKVPIVTEH